MKLVIAEKSMLAHDIARAICGKSINKNARLPISGNGYTVCACSGHLLRLLEPHEINPEWEKWDIESLPIYCDDWKKKPVADKQNLVDTIAELLPEADVVINAGDPDAEGQLLVDEVLEHLGWNGKTQRVYVNDNIEKNIRAAFEDLRDNEDCKAVGRSAYARQMADLCFGVNETRLASIRLGTKCRLGRVQTPTLGLVVERDKLIEGHVKRKFYELNVFGVAYNTAGVANESTLKFVPEENLLDDDKHVFEREKLEQVSASLQGFRAKIDIASKDETKAAPLPYNLTKLQSDMSEQYRFSAKKTLDITQALRDRYKAITYNRSDSQYLKEEHFEQARVVLEQAQKNCGKSWTLDYSRKSCAFNEKNVTAHHGIIPQEVAADINTMTPDEQKVYMAIVERYAMQFMPPAVYRVYKGEAPCPSGKLAYSAKVLVDSGYLSQVSNKENKDETCEQVLECGTYDFNATGSDIIEKETTPPKQYTEGSLITDMSCIAKYVKDEHMREVLKQKDDGKKGENGGIGTTATRASIIESLFESGYLEEKKGKLISTRKARELFEILPDDIKGADTTARWWLIQQDIENGIEDVNAVQRDVVQVFNSHKDSAYIGCKIAGAGGEFVGKCPKCGQNVISRGKIYTCSSNKSEKQGDTWVQTEGCGFKMFSSFAKKQIAPTQIEKLLAGAETLVNGLSGKKGKYSAYLKLDTTNASENGFYNIKISKFPNKKKK